MSGLSGLSASSKPLVSNSEPVGAHGREPGGGQTPSLHGGSLSPRLPTPPALQAYRANIVCPNKHVSGGEVMYDGHPLETETYIGGKARGGGAGAVRERVTRRLDGQRLPPHARARARGLDSLWGVGVSQ